MSLVYKHHVLRVRLGRLLLPLARRAARAFGAEWVVLTLLGVVIALIAFLMDYCITRLHAVRAAYICTWQRGRQQTAR